MNREWFFGPAWPFFVQPFRDHHDYERLIENQTCPLSDLDECSKSRLSQTRTWTNSHAGVVRLEKKSGNCLLVKANLPGVERDDVHLNLQESQGESILELTVDKTEEHESKDRYGGIFKRISQFQICRSIPLGHKIAIEDIKADLEDDNLVVEVKLPIEYGKEGGKKGDKGCMSRLDVHDESIKPVTSDTKKTTSIGKKFEDVEPRGYMGSTKR